MKPDDSARTPSSANDADISEIQLNVLTGVGESLSANLDLPSLGYRCVEHVATPRATHVILKKKGASSP